MTMRFFLLVVINRSLSVERRCPPGMPVWRCNRNLDRDTSCKPTNLAEDWGHHMYNMLVKSNAFPYYAPHLFGWLWCLKKFRRRIRKRPAGTADLFRTIYSVAWWSGMIFSAGPWKAPAYRYRPVSRILIAPRWRAWLACKPEAATGITRWLNCLSYEFNRKAPLRAIECLLLHSWLSLRLPSGSELEAAQKPARASEFLQHCSWSRPCPEARQWNWFKRRPQFHTKRVPRGWNSTPSACTNKGTVVLLRCAEFQKATFFYISDVGGVCHLAFFPALSKIF